MNKLLVHPQTEKQIDSFIERPSHAVLLSGPEGSGKYFLARHMAAQLLSISSATIDNYPYFLQLEKAEDKQAIIIKDVRALIDFLVLKVPTNQPVNRVVLIKDAQDMSTGAQNALLKSLEEPPEGTVFILTAKSANKLLPTIVSRTTRITIRPVSLETARAKLPDAKDLNSAWSLSQGNAGLLSSLVSSESHELKDAVNQAKNFLQSDGYDRLLMLDKMSREQLDVFLAGLGKVIQALYKKSAAEGNMKQAAKLTKAMRLVLSSRKDTENNITAKLIALRLALKLGL